MQNLHFDRFVACGLAGLITLSISGCGGGPTEPPPPRQLIGVSVQPASAQGVAPDGTVPFTATGNYDQAPSTQPNLPVIWTSSDPNVATVDLSGIATCLTAGGPVAITGSTTGKGGTVKGSGSLTCQLSPNPVAKLNPSGLSINCHIGGPLLPPICGCSWSVNTRTATLTNVGGAPLTITSLSGDSPVFSEANTCVGSTLDTGQSCDITANFIKPRTTGTFHGNFTITDDALGSPQTLELTAQVQCIP